MSKKKQAKLLKELRKGKKNRKIKRKKRQVKPVTPLVKEDFQGKVKKQKVGKKSKRKTKKSQKQIRKDIYEANKKRKETIRLNKLIQTTLSGSNGKELLRYLEKLGVSYIGSTPIMQMLYNFVLDLTMTRPNNNKSRTKQDYQNVLVDNLFNQKVLYDFLGQNDYEQVMELFVNYLKNNDLLEVNEEKGIYL